MIDSSHTDSTDNAPVAGIARGRRLRYGLGALTVAALMVGGVACSNDKKEDSAKKDDKTEQSEGKDNGSNAEATTPPSTVTDDEFNKSFDAIRSGIEDAGEDPCKLVQAFNTTPPIPSNENQVKAVLDTYEVLLKGMAGVVGADTEDGKALISAGQQMRSAAEAGKFKPEFLQGEDFGKIMSSEGVTKALGTFQTKAASCMTASSEPAADSAN